MHKAWPELLKRMKVNKASDSPKDRQLVISARTWFCLYLFEHQYVRNMGVQDRPLITLQNVLRNRETVYPQRR